MIEVGRNEITLVSTSVDKYFRTVSDALAHLINNREMGGVYVALTRPTRTLTRRLQDLVSLNDVFFIDCVTYLAEGPVEANDTTVYLESPTMLESILVKIGVQLGRVKSAEKFVFFDSINALTIYNGEKIISEFVHLLINNLAARDVSSVLISVKGQTPENIDNMLKMMCDRVVEVV
jgi:hypothetical protein